MPQRVTHTDVIPCPHISDHDTPYICLNVRVTRFMPRYKYIRDERNLDLDAFKQEFEQLPLSLVYSTNDPEMQLDLLNILIIYIHNDLRPISILPVLSKIHERLVLGQMEQFVSCGPTRVLKDTVCAYRKGHSTTTTLLAMKDDIVCAQKRGEVTMAVLADFSKAFDTVAFETVLKKLHVLGFSKSFLIWIVSYLTGRRQFVQVDDKASSLVDVTFGVR